MTTLPQSAPETSVAAVSPDLLSKRAARLIAFYLPQFYPTPENDEWWGKGFTEWTNVAKAKPLFLGHDQPRLPADLGFYDLRVPETRAAQAELARAHGIEGFCYWHYWFEGRRILDRPFDEVLRSGEPDFPFCLGWANHTWSRRWTGKDDDVLIKQTYSPEDDNQHARWLARAFADQRYIRIHNRPLFVIYNPHHLTDLRRTLDAIRNVVVKEGIAEPYIAGINLAHPEIDPRVLGFDGAINHQPQFKSVPTSLIYDGASKSRMLRNLKYRTVNSRLKILDYTQSMKAMLDNDPPYSAWPCVVVDWDTTPRHGNRAIIFSNASPEAFEQFLTQAIQRQSTLPAEERFVFVNAWNEWGEGMYLEPDLKHGKLYLQAVARAVGIPVREPVSV